VEGGEGLSNDQRHASLHGGPRVTGKKPKNLADSVRERLTHAARRSGDEFQLRNRLIVAARLGCDQDVRRHRRASSSAPATNNSIALDGLGTPLTITLSSAQYSSELSPKFGGGL
jgi:hypothetical protein